MPQPVAAFLCGENTGRNDAGETVSIHLASCSLVRVALLHLLLEPSLASWKLHAALLRLVAVARELALMAAMATVDAADHDATIAGACVRLVPLAQAPLPCRGLPSHVWVYRQTTLHHC